MAVFAYPPQVTYLHTKNEGGLKFFISNFASLSWRIALSHQCVGVAVMVDMTNLNLEISKDLTSVPGLHRAFH